MARHFIRLLGRCLGQAPTALVFAVIGGGLYWGHHHGWKVPRFDQLHAGGAPHNEAGAANRRATVQVLSTGAPGPGTPLYRVRLASAEAVRKSGIQVAPVETRPLRQHITATGRLDFDQTRYAELSSRAPGTVWRVFKQEGDRVAEGEVLGLVACADVGRAKSEFLKALVKHELADESLRLMRSISGSVPEAQVRAATAAAREADIALLNSHQLLLNYGLPLRLDDLKGLSQEKVFQRLRLLGLPAQLLGKSAVDTLPADLLPLRAPFAGEVVRRDMVEGEVITTSAPQFIVADVSTLWIVLDVRLEDAALLRRGRPASVAFDAGQAGGVARGELTWVSPAVDKPTRTVRARARVANPDGRLRPDTFGTGRIEIASSPSAVVVPAAAVQHDGDTALVFVAAPDGSFEARAVRPGLRDAEFVEVRAGLHPGEEVVTAGSHLLKSEIVRSRQAGGG